MTTKDFKKRFSQMPESYWLSGFVQNLIISGKYTDLLDYLRNAKDIEDVKDIETLYKLKGLFFELKSSCSAIITYIDKLDFDFLGDFEDKILSLEEIGLNISDKYCCVNDFIHWEMLLIKKGSIIVLDELKYAGKNSLIKAKFEKLITDDKYKKHFPIPSEIPLAFTFDEFSTYFSKI